jgi:phage major head subunit gpT-like protein
MTTIFRMFPIFGMLFKFIYFNAVIDTGLKLIGARSEFMARAAESQSAYKDLATRIQSRTKEEKYRWIGAAPFPRAWGNGRLVGGLTSEPYNVSDEKYESTMEIDREEIEDDQTGQIRIRIGELAQNSESHKDYLIALLLINGGTSGYNSYDGVTFFNSAHVFGENTYEPGTQSNDLTFAAAAGTTPTVQEFLDAYNQAVTALFKMKGDRSEPMMLTDSGIITIVPPDLRAVARTALNATILNNNSNVFAADSRVICFPWLTDAAKFFVFKTDAAIRPFIFQDRIPLEFVEMTPDHEHVFKTDRIMVGTRARYAMSYGRYEYAVRTTFT